MLVVMESVTIWKAFANVSALTFPLLNITGKVEPSFSHTLFIVFKVLDCQKAEILLFNNENK